MPNPKGLPLSEAVRFGWKTVQSSFGFILLTIVVATIVPSVIEWGGKHVFHRDGQQFLIKIVSALVSATFGLGLYKIYLRFKDGEKPIFENLFDGLARAHIWAGLHPDCHGGRRHGPDSPHRARCHHVAAFVAGGFRPRG
jgi:hypothetical protein